MTLDPESKRQGQYPGALMAGLSHEITSSTRFLKVIASIHCAA
jgi:hypothetical protein